MHSARKILRILKISAPETKEKTGAPEHHSPILKIGNSSLGAHIYSFLSANETLKATPTSKQFNSWDKNDGNNRKWREHLKTDFGCHENFVKYVPNAKQIYMRLYHLKNNPTEPLIDKTLEYLVLQAESGYAKNLKLRDITSIEKAEACLLSAIVVGDIELTRRLLPENWQEFLFGIGLNAVLLGGNATILRLMFAEQPNNYMAWHILHRVARSGDLPLLKFFINQFQTGNVELEFETLSTEGLLNNAAESGNETLVKWLLTEAPKEFRSTPTISTLTHAAKSGKFGVVHLLLSQKTVVTTWSVPNKAFCYASSYTLDYLSIALCPRPGGRSPERWKRLSQDQWSSPWRNALINSSSSGNFELTLFISTLAPKDLIKSDSELIKEAALQSALAGSEQLTNWWLQKLSYVDRFTTYCILNNAAQSKNVTFVTSLLSSTSKWVVAIADRVHALNYALESGIIPLVQIILERYNSRYFQKNFKTLTKAAKSKNFALIEWLASPERGDYQLIISEKMINKAIREYINPSYPSILPKESELLVPKTLELLNRARALVTREPSHEYKSPTP